MTRHVFNPQLPVIGETLVAPLLSQLSDVPCYKYADIDFVMNACENEYVRYVLNKIPIHGRHNRVLIDLKVHHLKKGQTPCVPGWHLDGSINPKKLPKQPETFTLFVTGSHALTEFMRYPFAMDVDARWDFAQMSNRCAATILEDEPAWSIPSCTFATYGDHHFHRGVAAREDEVRLLIRTTETDIIKPHNNIYIPHTNG